MKGKTEAWPSSGGESGFKIFEKFLSFFIFVTVYAFGANK